MSLVSLSYPRVIRMSEHAHCTHIHITRSHNFHVICALYRTKITIIIFFIFTDCALLDKFQSISRAQWGALLFAGIYLQTLAQDVIQIVHFQLFSCTNFGPTSILQRKNLTRHGKLNINNKYVVCHVTPDFFISYRLIHQRMPSK